MANAFLSEDNYMPDSYMFDILSLYQSSMVHHSSSSKTDWTRFNCIEWKKKCGGGEKKEKNKEKKKLNFFIFYDHDINQRHSIIRIEVSCKNNI